LLWVAKRHGFEIASGPALSPSGSHTYACHRQVVTYTGVTETECDHVAANSCAAREFK
jgi:hypothetical protein